MNTKYPLLHVGLAIKLKIREASHVSKDLAKRHWQWEGQFGKLGRICVLRCVTYDPVIPALCSLKKGWPLGELCPFFVF